MATTPTRAVRKIRERVGPRPPQRLAALAAIGFDAAALAVLIVLVIQQPAYALALVVTALAFVASSVKALISRGFRRAIAAIVAVALAVGQIVMIALWGTRVGQGAWMGPATLLLLAVGFALEKYALRMPPPEAVEPGAPSEGQGRRARHPVLIVNPRSGDGKAEAFDLVRHASECGIETVVLDEGDDLAELARRAIANGADALGMAGGDGSQALVLGIAAKHGVPFVCVPAGTRNHFALDLGLDRDDPRQALSAFTNGEERRIDYATVNGRLFVNNVALGAYAAIVEQESYREAKVQTALEVLPKLADDGGPWCDLEFDVPDHGRQDRTMLLMVSNNPYDFNASIGQRDRLDAGQLGVLALNPEKLSDLLGITVFAAARKPDLAKCLWTWPATTFRVDSPHEHISAGIDGETVKLRAPLEFQIVPGGARVLVPEGTRVGLQEQLAASGPRYSGLLEIAFNLPARRDDDRAFADDAAVEVVVEARPTADHKPSA